MAVAQHWPVLACYDDLAVYARWKGGRLPTEPELRLFFDMYEVGYDGGANVGFRNWHPVPLSVLPRPPVRVCINYELMFRATTGLAEGQGRGSNGGVWEWTATVFSGHEGMVPTDIFTG